ncbi:hypothetical protein LXL04_020492 [Taraxacum kok-saghyz]
MAVLHRSELATLERRFQRMQNMKGGVLKIPGRTEASVDLAILAGFDPVAVICEVVDDDDSMARLPKLKQFVEKENLKIILIADLIRWVMRFSSKGQSMWSAWFSTELFLPSHVTLRPEHPQPPQAALVPWNRVPTSKDGDMMRG